MHRIVEASNLNVSSVTSLESYLCVNTAIRGGDESNVIKQINVVSSCDKYAAKCSCP